MSRLNKKIGFIGCGNMGSAILKGLLSKKIVSSRQILIHDLNRTTLNSVSKKYGVRRAANNQALAQHSEVIFLAVKPQEFSTVAADIRSSLRKNHLVISILAGTPMAKLRKHLGAKCQLVRAMPNLGALVSEGITAVTGSSATAAFLARTLFSGCGKVILLKERYFNLVTAVSGSGPAYFFLMMELMSQAAQKGGLDKKSSDLLAIQTALGAALLAARSSERPDELRKRVTSKKGTTDAALSYLFQNHFSQIFIEAVDQARRRAEELSRS